MPTYQTITVDITPGAKEKPVINASQFDNGRPFNVALTWGGVPFTDAGDFDIEIHVKKPDGNIVTAEPDSVVNDVCSFLTTEQMCACHGNNECEIVLFDNDIQIGTGNFILDVEKAPDEGGIQSTSDIANLTNQIAEIVPEVIGDDYYNKTQTDALLANKADKSDTYTKAQVDTALAAKANTVDLATVATSGDYDDLINKPTIPAAQIQSDYTQADTTAVDYIKNKPDISGMIAAALLAVMPVETQTGNPCTFDTDIATALVSLSADIVASGGGGTPSTPIPIVGHSALNLDVNGTTFTVAFGQTVYGGVYDANAGKVKKTFNGFNIEDGAWVRGSRNTADTGYTFYLSLSDVKPLSNSTIKSSCFVFNSYQSTWENLAEGEMEIAGGNYLVVVADYADVPSFKAGLAGNVIMYELATPIEIDVSELSVDTIVGTNNITSDCNGDVTASYKVSIQKYVDDQ